MSTVKLLDGKLAGVNVSVDGQTDWFKVGDALAGGVALGGKLVTLTGGSSPTVTVQVEHSPDQAFITDLGSAWSAWTAPGNQEAVMQAGPIFGHVRFTWTTTGSPSAATADFHLQAAGA